MLIHKYLKYFLLIFWNRIQSIIILGWNSSLLSWLMSQLGFYDTNSYYFPNFATCAELSSWRPRCEFFVPDGGRRVGACLENCQGFELDSASLMMGVISVLYRYGTTLICRSRGSSLGSGEYIFVSRRSRLHQCRRWQRRIIHPSVQSQITIPCSHTSKTFMSSQIHRPFKECCNIPILGNVQSVIVRARADCIRRSRIQSRMRTLLRMVASGSQRNFY